MNCTFNLERRSIYKGIEYEVVELLDNGLMLVVNRMELENKNFPLSTFIIPDDKVGSGND